MSLNEMLPLREIAKHLRISDKLALKLVGDQRIKAVKIGGRWRVSRTELQRLMREGTG